MKKITLLLVALVSLNYAMAQTDYYPVYDGTFDGTVYTQTFSFPTGAQDWAGFANNNSSIYRLSYPNGGQVSFKATVAADAEVYFRFEANPYPNVDPAVVTSNVMLLASNPDETAYTVDIPAHATNTYNSALMYVVTRDVDVVISEAKITTNAPTAGIDAPSLSSIKMHPNPANGVLKFTRATTELLNVSVYDLLGKQVMPAQTIKSELNISSLNPGMYFIRMDQGASSFTKKLIVK